MKQISSTLNNFLATQSNICEVALLLLEVDYHQNDFQELILYIDEVNEETGELNKLTVLL